MFVTDQVRLPVGITAARARLANLAHGDSLLAAARDAYDDQGTALVRVGPASPAPGLSRLVRVHYLELVEHGDAVVLTFRWEATGPGGTLFPALDADITLTPEGADATLLTLNGAYRPPLGTIGAGLDRAILHRVGDATIRAFVQQLGDAITHPASVADTEPRIAPARPSWLPADPEPT